MNIVLIHAQNRKQTTYHLGWKFIQSLTGDHHVLEFILPKDLPNFCTGCYTCMHKSHEGCPHKTAILPIMEAILEADVLVFTTPVYCLRTPASMKALLDHLFVWWMVHRPQKDMFYKHAVIIAAGAGAGMKSAAKDIKTSFTYWGISHVQTIHVRSMAESWSDMKEDHKQKVYQKLSKVAKNIENKHLCVKLKIKAIFYMMRWMIKKDMSASPTDHDYWKTQGWLAKKRPWHNS